MSWYFREVTLSINGQILSTANGPNMAAAKDQCAQEALAKLQKLCYTLVVSTRLQLHLILPKQAFPYFLSTV